MAEMADAENQLLPPERIKNEIFEDPELDEGGLLQSEGKDLSEKHLTSRSMGRAEVDGLLECCPDVQIKTEPVTTEYNFNVSYTDCHASVEERQADEELHEHSFMKIEPEFDSDDESVSLETGVVNVFFDSSLDKQLEDAPSVTAGKRGRKKAAGKSVKVTEKKKKSRSLMMQEKKEKKKTAAKNLKAHQEEKKKQAKERKTNAVDTKEGCRIRMAAKRARMTEEEKAAKREVERLKRAAQRNNMTEEERQAEREANRLRAKARRASMTAEQKAAAREAERLRKAALRANMTEEEKQSERLKEMKKEMIPDFFPNMTDEELEAHLAAKMKSFIEGMANFTEEERMFDTMVKQPSVCELCGRGFTSREALRKHYKVRHTNKDIFCVDCGQMFYCKRDLVSHVKHCPVRVEYAAGVKRVSKMNEMSRAMVDVIGVSSAMVDVSGVKQELNPLDDSYEETYTQGSYFHPEIMDRAEADLSLTSPLSDQINKRIAELQQSIDLPKI